MFPESIMKSFQVSHRKGGALMGASPYFSGGGFIEAHDFRVGIMPYISASIILQLLTVVVPHLSVSKEGEREKKNHHSIHQVWNYLIALIQVLVLLSAEGMNDGAFVLDPGWSFRLMTVITLVAGTAFLMWLGEQITERGVGNSISLIIFSGIGQCQSAVVQTFDPIPGWSNQSPLLLVLGVGYAGSNGAIVFLKVDEEKLRCNMPNE